MTGDRRFPGRPQTASPAIMVLALALVLSACTARAAVNAADARDVETHGRILQLLARDGSRLSYEGLMEVDALMADARRPIAHMHDLLAQMIGQRNPHPRVDQMILIKAAGAIGYSPYPIPRAVGLLDAILDQPARLNEWVISFVADAIGRYPFEIEDGDALVDRLEARLRGHRRNDDGTGEHFGFHFLPPPRLAPIRAYLAGLRHQHQREQERRRYYQLIRHNIAEHDIAASLSFLQARQGSNDDPACRLLMLCLVQMKDRIPLR